MNLSSVHLNDHELSLLDRGLTFIPKYRTARVSSIYALQNRLVRNLKLKDYYCDEEDDGSYDYNVKTFVAPSTWTPRDASISPETLHVVQEIVTSTENLLASRDRIGPDLVRLRGSRDNLSAEERRALKRLMGDTSIVIKPADKGSATVVVDVDAYLAEGYRQLNQTRYYRRLEEPIFRETGRRINSILERMEARGSISEAQLRYLRATDEDRARRFYMLPKIHKPRSKWPQPDRMPEGRPIVSDSGSESIRVAQYVDSFLMPLSTRHPAYLKDTYDFLGKIRGQRIPRGALLVTGDVTALYTNMTIDRMMAVVKDVFRRTPDASRPDEELLELLDLTLRSNDFGFNGETFLQVCGTAMGKPYAPSLANLYLLEFDRRAHLYRTVPLFYFRFIDDVFFVWTGTEEDLREFNVYLNTLIDGITVTLEWSPVSVHFLDTTVYLSRPADGLDATMELQTRVYFKETDTHQLLHRDSFHPRHAARGILKSQMLRFKRISSTRADYGDACAVLMDALATRGYNRRLMRTVKSEVWSLDQGQDKTDGRKVLPVIVPYNDVGCSLARLWKNALSSSELFGQFRLITAYTVADNLHRKLVHSLLHSDRTSGRDGVPPVTDPAHGAWGCYHCPSTRCRAHCHVVEGATFSSSHNHRTYPVRGRIDCRTCSVVYLVACARCGKQYVGETSRALRDRLNDHLSNVRLRKQTPVGLHFNLPGHSLGDLQITGIERFQPGATSIRKAKELTWQNLLQTAHPLGINSLRRSDS